MAKKKGLDPSKVTLPLTLAVKLGSIVVHVEELLAPQGHHFDRAALEALLRDEEVASWLKAMGPLVPCKR